MPVPANSPRRRAGCCVRSSRGKNSPDSKAWSGADREGRVQSRIELLVEADRVARLPEPERSAAIEQLKARYAQIAESPEDLRTTLDRFNKIAEGEAFEPDPNALYAVNEAMSRLNTDSGPAEREEVRDLILELAPQIGEEKAVAYLEDLGKRLEPAKAYAVKTSVDNLVARGVIDKSYADVMRCAAEKFVNEQTGPFDPGSVYSFTAGMAANLPEEARPPAEELYTPEKINMVYGALQIGGYRDPTTGQIVQWVTDKEAKEGKWTYAWEKAVAYATLNLYGNDAAMARAMEIIKQRYPEANIEPGKISVPWASLPEEIKQKDFNMLREHRKLAPWYSTSTFVPIGGWSREALKKAKDEDMTLAKFSNWLSEQGQIRMVPAPAKQAARKYPTATNPTTGERLIFRDGKWQPL